MNIRHLWLTIGATLTLTACTGVPEGITPVSGFEKSRYLGTWYEIARLDHSFERGLDQVTATYTERDDGGIKVINRGYHTQKDSWETAEGKAFFVGESDIAHLKVSFFGPFYASYVIAALDKDNYDYALVTGPDTGYLWILSRTPSLPQATLERLLAQAQQSGFDTSQLIYVNH